MAYVSPPIVEAVFDMQFEGSLTEGDIRRVARQLTEPNAIVEEQHRFSLTVESGGGSRQDKQFVGMRIVDRDANYMVLVRAEELATIKLAPYETWEAFEPHAWRNYQHFKRTVGVRKVKRAALRYVNRIDVRGDITDFSEYVRLAVSMPSSLQDTQYHLMSAAKHNAFEVVLNCGNAISPLVGYSSFLLDIDVYASADIPQQDDKLRSVFGELRLAKNAIFEDIITSTARRLFEGHDV